MENYKGVEAETHFCVPYSSTLNFDCARFLYVNFPNFSLCRDRWRIH
jgi:hypothetical protein